MTTEVRTCEILRFEILRHRALAKLSALPQLSAAHLEVAEALERAVAVLEKENKAQPKTVAK